MLPEDIQDSIFAIILLIGLALVIPFFGFSGVSYASQIPDLHDEDTLFLINYLKVDVGESQIADLIALNEILSNNVDIPLKRVTKSLISFYGLGGISGRNYLLTATYPNGRREVIDATLSWDISQPNHVKTTEGKKTQVQIPSLNKGLITVELEVENE